MLIIWGGEDRLIPVSHFNQFVNDFPKAERVLIPGCGHMPQEECPLNMLKPLLAFLDTLKK